MEGQIGAFQGDIVIEVNGQPPLGGQVGQFPAGYGENFELLLANDMVGQGEANNAQVRIVESPSNAEMMMASAAGGIFSLQAADQFVDLIAAE